MADKTAGGQAVAASSSLQQTRRSLLATTTLALLFAPFANVEARTFGGVLPWIPESADPPTPFQPGGWHYFDAREASTMEAIVERLIPGDDLGPGGRDVGCAVFIDRQLAGPYGDSRRLYMRPPFAKAAATLGPQSQDGPAAQYRRGLAAINAYCRTTFANKEFSDLSPAEQDTVLTGLEKGTIALSDGVAGPQFFKLMLQNTKEGFLADPIYGGNRDMAGWVLIGFPGARYDYRDHIEKHNVAYPLPPVGIMGRSSWNQKS
ncbi:gluconate 2-dehydrogenase subunit 3 family protein [Beijerinckia sp. L45]|uniref:gluconate 2-dehydrogenase subunit 3 family protein n=1 Tax=Beijerinckia sp. L45 TaxID=1641855 RepID=UPI00131DCC72|nr:gluconate 2-dehydrogenase subunit 3 family protein [Beijerinckia sp. L45]